MSSKPNGRASVGHNAGHWRSRIVNVLDHDPEIDRFVAIWHREKKLNKASQLALLAGLSASTVDNLANGKTRRPQHATFTKLFGAIGYRYRPERVEVPDYDKEIEKARGEYKLYKATLAKRKPRKK